MRRRQQWYERRGEIGMGDFLKAVDALGAGEDSVLAGRIAVALGLASVAAAPASRLKPPLHSLELNLRRKAREEQLVPKSPAASPEPPRGAIEEDPVGQDDEIDVIDGPAASQHVGLAPSTSPAAASPEPFPVPHDPLFSSIQSPALIAAAVAAERPEGDPDLERLVDAIVCRLPVVRIQRLPRTTLARGAQIILDLSHRMEPHRRDQYELLAQVDRLIVDGLIQVVRVDDDPREMWSPERGSFLPYAPPTAGTPVLALTDLGVRDLENGLAGTAEAWLEVEANVRRAHCSLLCLVPYPPGRWPPALAARIAMVAWDRMTMAAAVKHAARRARRR